MLKLRSGQGQHEWNPGYKYWKGASTGEQEAEKARDKESWKTALGSYSIEKMHRTEVCGQCRASWMVLEKGRRYWRADELERFI